MHPVGFMFGQAQYIIYIIYIAERLPLQYKDTLTLGKEKMPRLKGERAQREHAWPKQKSIRTFKSASVLE